MVTIRTEHTFFGWEVCHLQAAGRADL